MSTRSATKKPRHSTKRQPRSRRVAVQQRSDHVVFSVVAVLVVFGSLFGIVAVQTLIVQNRVQLDVVNSDLDVQRERNRQLRLQVIELEAPERILETAVTRLGMTRPEERNYLPGLDPDLESVRLPPSQDPFGPAPLPVSLGGDS